MLRWLRVSQDRSGMSQDDVLRRRDRCTNVFTEDAAANQRYDLWEPMIGRVKESRGEEC